MATRVAGAELAPGMVVSMRAGSWLIEAVTTLVSESGNLIRLDTRGLMTGSRRSMVVGPRRELNVAWTKELA